MLHVSVTHQFDHRYVVHIIVPNFSHNSGVTSFVKMPSNYCAKTDMIQLCYNWIF